MFLVIHGSVSESLSVLPISFAGWSRYHTQTDTCRNTDTHTLTYIHARIHANMHARIHIHARTHMRTHTKMLCSCGQMFYQVNLLNQNTITVRIIIKVEASPLQLRLSSRRRTESGSLRIVKPSNGAKCHIRTRNQSQPTTSWPFWICCYLT